MKFCYEIYEFGDRGRIFKGFKTVAAEDSESAYEQALSGLADNCKLVPIYIPNS